MASSSKIAATMVGSSSSRDVTTQRNLLEHVNDLRRYANLETLNDFVANGGHGWLEAMVDHAKVSYKHYKESEEDDTITGNVHQMAGDLLKTPSRKKGIAHKTKKPATKKQGNKPREPSPDPFGGDDVGRVPLVADNNKENTNGRQASSSDNNNSSSSGLLRSTRSRADKSQLIEKLPNPFQKRVLEAKENAKKASTKVKSSDVTEEGSPVSAAGPSQVKKQGKTTTGKATAKQTARNASTAKKTGQSKPAEASSKASAVQEASFASTAFVSATDGAGNEENGIHFEESREDFDEGKATPSMEVEEGDEPRESTPPPQSPTKAERDNASFQARLKLEESLARLTGHGDDEFCGSEDEENEDDAPAEDEDSARTKVGAHRDFEDQETLEIQIKGEVAQSPPSSDVRPSDARPPSVDHTNKQDSNSVPASDDSASTRPVVSMMEDLGLGKPLSTTLTSTKRALSSFSTTKRANVVATAPEPATMATTIKSSFLSKSLRMASSENSLEEEKSSGPQEDRKEPSNSEAGTAAPSPAPRSPPSSEVPAESSSSSSSSSSRKRKNSVVEVDNATKTSSPEKTPTDASSKARKVSPQTSSAKEAQTSQQSAKATLASLRSQIETYSKPASQKSTTNAVGLGQKGWTSPVLGRFASQMSSRLPKSPTKAKGAVPGSEAGQLKLPASPGKNAATSTATARSSPAKPSRLPLASTTPANSPGPKAVAQPRAAVDPSPSKSLSPDKGPSNSRVREEPDAKDKVSDGPEEEDNLEDDVSTDSGEESSSADDERSEGDLLLEEIAASSTRPLQQQQQHSQTRPSNNPRPPGASMIRPMAAMPRNAAQSSHTIKLPSKMAPSTLPPSSSTSQANSGWLGKVKSFIGLPPGIPVPVSSASGDQSSSSTQTTSSQPHSISSSSGFVPKTIHNSAGAKAGMSKPAELPRPASALNTSHTSSSKPQSVIRAEAARKKETEKAREREERLKQIQAQREAREAAASNTGKREREETKPKATAPAQQRPAVNASNNAETAGNKKRKSNEGAAVPVKAAAQLSASTTNHKLGKPPSQQNLRLGQPSASARPMMPSKPASQQAQSTKSSQQQAVFSNQNVFQMAKASTSTTTNLVRPASQQVTQAHGQPQRQGTGSRVVQPAQAQGSQPKKPQKPQKEEYIELEEPPSEYSDSEDEATIARRAKHKPWETREGLEAALLQQADIDADEIFGVPQGNVPLEEMIPPQSEHEARARRRPRSSSANWSGKDGLQQYEIDRYNKRLGIVTGSTPALASSSVKSPVRTSSLAQDARMQARQG
ncbi:hypothetical protein FA10DRAFT_156128 [Acaromyces ingoldii]|uniref:Inner centromere protein ARK-binding domain-containing protein n=1 Tax=Acaromyces ingoldii TaxID=215250 RepID=A0A316YG75_9BASI|nr:hypothetical protein FA10DRAFT_156128 [Acaromyces ingoldii]PWN88162.1 hypothetical protein FA10DRAFT_156128 [Acaromyces ingoldii]